MPTTSITMLRDWFDQGVAEGATHMVVVCDTFDWSDYPVYVMPFEHARSKAAQYDGKNMQKVMEVYNLSKTFSSQVAAGARVMNYDDQA